MSSTARGSNRHAYDYYATPAWCVRRLMERLEAPPSTDGIWYEPCAGDGAIIRALGPGYRWVATELQVDAEEWFAEGRASGQIPADTELHLGDFRESEIWPGVGQIITNPPFSLASDLIIQMRRDYQHARLMVLQRLNFIGSVQRYWMFVRDMPDIYILPNRPGFGGFAGKTDSIEYAWFVWRGGIGRPEGKVILLAQTSLEERRSDQLALDFGGK